MVATSLNNLASLLYETNCPADVEPLMCRALSIVETLDQISLHSPEDIKKFIEQGEQQSKRVGK